MVINSVTAFSIFFFLRRIAADITIVIICPHQRQLFRHLQTAVIKLEHFLIRDECHHRIVPQRLLQNFLLVTDHHRKQLYFGLPFLFRSLPLQSAGLKTGIMDAPHPERIAHFKLPVLFHALAPVFFQDLPVLSRNRIIIYCVLISLFFNPRLPFPVVRTHQHITMGSTDHDPHALRKRPVFRHHIEGIYMHGGPDIIPF